MITLRAYQEKAVEAVYRFLETRNDNPCVVIPTGGGKTPIIARICSDAVVKWDGRVIILAHVKELLEQSYKHLERDAEGAFGIGLYSAGLGSRDTGYPVTIAGIQSAYRNVDDFPAANLIIVDEAHRIPPDGEGMYRTFLAAMKAKNPDVRLIGFTATPYRMSTGSICAPENLLNRICFEVGVRELITLGFLSRLVSRSGTVDTNFEGVSIKRGEFDQHELEALMLREDVVGLAVCDIVARTKDRKKILVFCSGVAHGNKVAELLREAEIGTVGEIYGSTPSEERAELVKRFRDGDLRVLVNVEVLTLGFDAPNVDCVCLLRATMSAGLYYQMVGRGFRTAMFKEDCQVLDFGGNVVRHGPVDCITPDDARDGRGGDGEAPAKKCPQCCLISPAGVSACPECQYEFPKKIRGINHSGDSYDGSVVTNVEEVDILDVKYKPHVGKASGITSMAVHYMISNVGIWVSEYVCLEHAGYARSKAEMWWTRRAGAGPVPKTVIEGITKSDKLVRPRKIRVEFGGKYPQILGYTFVKDQAGAVAS